MFLNVALGRDAFKLVQTGKISLVFKLTFHETFAQGLKTILEAEFIQSYSRHRCLLPSKSSVWTQEWF